jgi:hypothetical protein
MFRIGNKAVQNPFICTVFYPLFFNCVVHKFLRAVLCPFCTTTNPTFFHPKLWVLLSYRRGLCAFSTEPTKTTTYIN